MKLIFLGFFLLTTIIHVAENGFAAADFSGFAPTWLDFLRLVPLPVFGYLGFDAANNASGEMHNP